MNIEFLEKVYIRGLEGLVSDRYLSRVIGNNDGSFGEYLSNHMEAKYIGIQLFFQAKGFGLQ